MIDGHQRGMDAGDRGGGLIGSHTGENRAMPFSFYLDRRIP
jgi:hypothetical protein